MWLTPSSSNLFLITPITCLAFQITAHAVTIPAGTVLEVRLTSEVTSNKPSALAATGVVYVPVLVNGARAINPGIQLSGCTADVVARQIHALALVNRTGLGPDLSNATGGKLQTDCKIAVLEF